MDSYVIRIYRRNDNSPQDLVGLVELVDVNKERVFTNFEELRAILMCRQAPAESGEGKGGAEQ